MWHVKESFYRSCKLKKRKKQTRVNQAASTSFDAEHRAQQQSTNNSYLNVHSESSPSKLLCLICIHAMPTSAPCSPHVTASPVSCWRCSLFSLFLPSGLLVHLPLAVWTHVWSPLYANQTLHPQQGELIIRRADADKRRSLLLQTGCCFFFFSPSLRATREQTEEQKKSVLRLMIGVDYCQWCVCIIWILFMLQAIRVSSVH